MTDLVALGELLIDFTPTGISDRGNLCFEENPGGAPANVLASMAKLDKKCAYIGMVGNDQFGIFLRDVLRKNDIDVTGLKFSRTANTTLAFVHLDSKGERSFVFYRNPGADMMLTSDDIDYNLIKQAKIFHFGSISMTNEPSRSATLTAVKFAKKNNLIISYDPNYRPLLWPSKEQAVTIMKSGLKFTDIVKVSEEELELLTGTNDLVNGSSILYEMGIRIALITLGSKGCFYRYPGGTGTVSAFNVQAIDTNGAGDAFLGGVLYWLSDLSINEIEKIDRNEFQRIIRFANAMGALTTTKQGAIPALPYLNEVNRLVNE